MEVGCQKQRLEHDRLEGTFGPSIQVNPTEVINSKIMWTMCFGGRLTVTRPRTPRRKDMGKCVTLAIWADRSAVGDKFLILAEDRSVVQFCRYAAILHCAGTFYGRTAQFL